MPKTCCKQIRICRLYHGQLRSGLTAVCPVNTEKVSVRTTGQISYLLHTTAEGDEF